MRRAHAMVWLPGCVVRAAPYGLPLTVTRPGAYGMAARPTIVTVETGARAGGSCREDVLVNALPLTTSPVV